MGTIGTAASGTGYGAARRVTLDMRAAMSREERDREELARGELRDAVTRVAVSDLTDADAIIVGGRAYGVVSVGAMPGMPWTALRVGVTVHGMMGAPCIGFVGGEDATVRGVVGGAAMLTRAGLYVGKLPSSAAQLEAGAVSA